MENLSAQRLTTYKSSYVQAFHARTEDTVRIATMLGIMRVAETDKIDPIDLTMFAPEPAPGCNRRLTLTLEKHDLVTHNAELRITVCDLRFALSRAEEKIRVLEKRLRQKEPASKIQALQTQVDEQQSEIERLRAENAALKAAPTPEPTPAPEAKPPAKKRGPYHAEAVAGDGSDRARLG